MRSARGLLASLAFSGGAALVAPSAGASIVIALDLPTMVEKADNVAVVDVVSVKSAWDARHERILTTIDLVVVETWKGPAAPASHFKIVQPGGTVDDISTVVYGMSRFAQGERALVFLRGPADRAGVVGMAQGKRAVLHEAGTGRLFVQAPDKAGALFVRGAPTASGTAPSGTPVLETRARPMGDLRAEIRALVANAGKGK